MGAVPLCSGNHVASADNDNISYTDIMETKKNPIILIGYRGTGKTTIARKIAGQLAIPVKDSDAEIECRAGKTIAEIFGQDGEAVFRDLEESVIAEILHSGERLVMATGGGAVLRSSTRELLRRSGTVFWLTATPATLLHRISGDIHSKTMRPNLTPLPMMEEIASVLEKRIPLYQSTAHQTVCTESATPDEIAQWIIDHAEPPFCV
jgi:shikimate kinase